MTRFILILLSLSWTAFAITDAMLASGQPPPASAHPDLWEGGGGLRVPIAPRGIELPAVRRPPPAPAERAFMHDDGVLARQR